MPATALRCRICETEVPLDPVGVCGKCFGPLEPIYDPDRKVTRAQIEAGPPNIWRYAPMLPTRLAWHRGSHRSSPHHASRTSSESASCG